MLKAGAISLLCLAWLLAPLQAWSQTALQVIPPLTAHVIDTTGTLSAAQRDALDTKLAAFEKAKGAQIVVLLVPTLIGCALAAPTVLRHVVASRRAVASG